jgi:hypothetical protein
MSNDARLVAECVEEGHHDRLKSDPVAWTQQATPIGTMVKRDGSVIEGANCRRCTSTIWRTKGAA